MRKAARNFFPRQRSKLAGRVISAPIKKIRRRRNAGELAVEQTGDERVLASLLAASPFPGYSLDQLGNCCLVAYLGDQPVGALCLATELDNALIRFLLVLATHRRRKIGTALLAAAPPPPVLAVYEPYICAHLRSLSSCMLPASFRRIFP